MIKLAVLASGGGTDLQSVIDASEKNEIDAKVVVVVSDKENAFALKRAKKHGIDAYFVDSKNKTREEHEKKVSEILDLPKNLRPIVIVPVGYPAEEPKTPPRLAKEELIKFIK